MLLKRRDARHLRNQPRADEIQPAMRMTLRRRSSAHLSLGLSGPERKEIFMNNERTSHLSQRLVRRLNAAVGLVAAVPAFCAGNRRVKPLCVDAINRDVSR